MSKDNIRDHWNLIYKDYQKKRTISFEDIDYSGGYAKESELNLLGNVKGKNVIELGCGGAENSIILTKKGALCTGIDLSIEQLNYARNSVDKHGVEIELIEGDFENLSIFDEASFDIALSIFAFDWAQELNVVFKEVYRILNNGGIFVFSMEHPILNLLGDNPKELKITENYFEKIIEWEGSTGIPLKAQSPKISDLINLLIENGFTIKKLIEPQPLEDKVTLEECYPLDVIKRVPSTIIIKALKIS